MQETNYPELAKDAICKLVKARGYRCQVSKEDDQYILWIDIEGGKGEMASTTMTARIISTEEKPSGALVKVSSMGKKFNLILRKDGKISGESEFIRSLDKKIKKEELNMIYLAPINESLERIAKILSEGVAEEIYTQIGKRAFYMMGAKNIAKGKDGSKEYLQFQIGRNPKNVNIVKVQYDSGRDLYNLIFYNLRGTNLKVKSEVEGVYADMLHDILKSHTGMALSL